MRNAESLRIDGPNGPFDAYVSRPPAPARPDTTPAIVVIHELFGMTPHISRVADRLADAGFCAVAPDLYRGRGTAPYDDPERQKALVAHLKDEEVLADVAATLDALPRLVPLARERDTAQEPHRPGPAGLIGFCLGGRLAFLSAATFGDRIGAIVSCYGGRIASPGRWPGEMLRPLDRAASLTAPALLLYGAEDPLIASSERETVAAELTRLGKPHDVHVYQRAGHGFLCEDRPDYRPDVATQAWRAIIGFLRHALEAHGG